MVNRICITHKWVPFMDADGSMLVRCTQCGAKMYH